MKLTARVYEFLTKNEEKEPLNMVVVTDIDGVIGGCDIFTINQNGIEHLVASYNNIPSWVNLSAAYKVTETEHII